MACILLKMKNWYAWYKMENLLLERCFHSSLIKEEILCTLLKSETQMYAGQARIDTLNIKKRTVGKET